MPYPTIQKVQKISVEVEICYQILGSIYCTSRVCENATERQQTLAKQNNLTLYEDTIEDTAIVNLS